MAKQTVIARIQIETQPGMNSRNYCSALRRYLGNLSQDAESELSFFGVEITKIMSVKAE